MEFLIANRFVVENKFPGINSPFGLISITDPSESPVDMSKAKSIGGDSFTSLQLCFHDVDSIKIADTYKLTTFSSEMANRILGYLEGMICRRISVILVQCNAGISRSAGVAAALSLIVNGNDSWVFDDKKYLPNRLVYRTILQVHYGIENVSMKDWKIEHNPEESLF